MTILNYETATFLPKRSIGPFVATVTLEEMGRDEIEITQHPIQQGGTITDHAFIKPATLTINAMWNNQESPLHETYTKLLGLQRLREPFDVVTGKRIYKNLLIKSISQTTDANTNNSLNISMELQEVILTSIEVTSVPERKKQATPTKTSATQNAGTKQAEKISNQSKKRSALLTLVKGGG